MNITKLMLCKDDTPCADGLAWFLEQKDQSLVGLVKAGIEGGKDTMDYINWGLHTVMTKEQRIEYGIYAAYQVAYLWKDKYPEEFKIWDKWASGRDRGDAARAAARDASAAAWAARAAAWAAGDAAWAASDAAVAAGDAAVAASDAAGDAAYNKVLARILRYGAKLLMGTKEAK